MSIDVTDFVYALLSSLADIRTALWSLVAAVSLNTGAIMAHALLTRKRKR